MDWARAANLASKQQPDIFVETLREKAKSMESPTEITLRLIKAQHLWDAGEMCYALMNYPYGSQWNVACQHCGVAIQGVARDLDPFVGDEEGRKKAMLKAGGLT
jgi:hypothetical protein